MLGRGKKKNKKKKGERRRWGWARLAARWLARGGAVAGYAITAVVSVRGRLAGQPVAGGTPVHRWGVLGRWPRVRAADHGQGPGAGGLWRGRADLAPVHQHLRHWPPIGYWRPRIAALIRREWFRPTRVVIGCALAMTLAVALLAAAGTPNEGRVNNHVYGRYVAIFGGRSGRSSPWPRCCGPDGVGPLLWWPGGPRSPDCHSRRWWCTPAGGWTAESYVDFDAPELSFLSGDWDSLHIYRMTLFAVGFMVLFGLVAWPRRAAAGRRTRWGVGAEPGGHGRHHRQHQPGLGRRAVQRGDSATRPQRRRAAR